MDMRRLACPIDDNPPIVVPGKPQRSFTLWLEFEWWQPEPDDHPYDDFFNMHIHLSTGHSYALNVWTFDFLTTIRQRDLHSGACLGGRYLLPPDLLVEKLDRAHVEAVVLDLLATNHLRDEWRITNNDD